jgi:glycosyltransferase involved in cell wall biosynthesis
MTAAALDASLVIPVHNGEKYLAECIQSALGQERVALEILVVDNGSTDGTSNVVRKFPYIRYFHLEERGLVKALNHGVENSRGAFLAFLDADDLWRPNKLATQLEAFARNPVVDMVFGHIEQFVSPELPDPIKARLSIRNRRLPGRHRSTLLIRRKSFWKVGLFTKDQNFAEFIEWYMRAKEQGLQELMLPDVLALRRIHGANYTYTDRDKRIEYVRILKRGLDRRRRLRDA